MRKILVASALLFLGGCATHGMSEAECRMADWRAIGFEDGSRGAAASSFGAHRKACSEHGVSPDFDDYLAGHAQGLESFCRPENGARLGEAGYRYTGVCPKHLEGPFLEAHALRYGLYERRVALEGIDRRLHQCRERSKHIEVLVVDKTALLVAPHLTPASRANLAVELKQLAEEKIELGREIHALEHDRIEAEEEYAHYQNRVAYRDTE